MKRSEEFRVEAFYAKRQLGGITTSTREGNPPIYEPRLWDTREVAEKFLIENLIAETAAVQGCEWEVVEF